MKNSQRIAELAFEWCQKYWGSPLKSRKCQFVVSYDRRVKNYTGLYIDRLIRVYPLNCPTNKDLIQTIIHEYCHFLQMPCLSDNKYYSQMDDLKGYEKNPYEIQARKFETKYYKKCKKYIKSRLNERKLLG